MVRLLAIGDPMLEALVSDRGLQGVSPCRGISKISELVDRWKVFLLFLETKDYDSQPHDAITDDDIVGDPARRIRVLLSRPRKTVASFLSGRHKRQSSGDQDGEGENSGSDDEQDGEDHDQCEHISHRIQGRYRYDSADDANSGSASEGIGGEDRRRNEVGWENSYDNRCDNCASGRQFNKVADSD